MRDGVLVRVEGIPAPPLTSLLLCLCHSALEHNGLFNSSSLWGSLSPTDSQGLPGAAAALSVHPSISPSVRLSPRLLRAAPGSPRFASPAPEPELPPARRLNQPRAAPFRAVGNYTTAKELPVGRRRPGNGCVAQIAAARSHGRSCAGKLAQTFDSFFFLLGEAPSCSRSCGGSAQGSLCWEQVPLFPSR